MVAILKKRSDNLTRAEIEAIEAEVEAEVSECELTEEEQARVLRKLEEHD